MKKSPIAPIVLAVAALMLLTWTLLKGMSHEEEPTSASSAARAKLKQAPTLNAAAPSRVETSPVTTTAKGARSPALLVGNRPLAAAILEGFQSTNYRQYVHQALAEPSAVRIRVSLELARTCGLVGMLKPAPGEPVRRLPPDLSAELQRRTRACEQSSGPDWQQLQALSATKKRSFDEADELLTFRVLKGTQDELATFLRLGDVGGMANWGVATTPEHLMLLVGDEEVFLQHPSAAPVTSAWQAAVCERFTCDDFNARIVRCRDEASCQMSLQDILKESAGVDDAAWQQLLAAARRRLDALLPR